jgi:putative tryptophan/tyrosine transport system substrate-binding protein
MSALGQKQTSDQRASMSALPPKADIRPSNATQDFGREVKGVSIPFFWGGTLAEKNQAKSKFNSGGGRPGAASNKNVISNVYLVPTLSHTPIPAQREFVAGGGLISYSADFFAQFRAAAGYVDRILKGEKPANLPVQSPTNYELVINLKTAGELGLSVPQALLATAQEVIE